MSKKVVVCIPTYNRRDLVCEAIDSVLSSSFNDFDIYVFDNHSMDRTVEYINNKYGEKIEIFNQEKNIGLGGNANYILETVISAGRYEYLLMLHDDDILKKDFLKKTFELIESDENISFVGTAYEVIDEQKKVLSLVKYGFSTQVVLDWKNYFSYRLHGLTFPWSGSLIRLNKIKSNRFNYEEHPYFADQIFFALLAIDNKVAYIPEELFQYRTHDRAGTRAIKKEVINSELLCEFDFFSNFFKKYNFDSSIIKEYQERMRNIIFYINIEKSRTYHNLFSNVYRSVFDSEYFEIKHIKLIHLKIISRKFVDIFINNLKRS